MRASIALPASGRLNTSQPTGPRRSTISVSYAVLMRLRPPALDHRWRRCEYRASGSAPGPRSAPRDVAPRRAVVRIGFAREAQHALTEDVLVDLGRAALDRVGPAAQHPAHLRRERVAGPRHRVGAEHVDREHLDALVERALVDLADRALGAGRPA